MAILLGYGMAMVTGTKKVRVGTVVSVTLFLARVMPWGSRFGRCWLQAHFSATIDDREPTCSGLA